MFAKDLFLSAVFQNSIEKSVCFYSDYNNVSYYSIVRGSFKLLLLQEVMYSVANTLLDTLLWFAVLDSAKMDIAQMKTYL